MRRSVVIFIMVIAGVMVAAARVKPGIEVLASDGFEQLRGKRVGLITNPTGVDHRLRATADILNEADGVELVAFFAPEHGIRGDVTAGAAVANSRDELTGIPVYSIYGKIKKPTAEMLRDIDVLVYDIQDIGTRSYTFISTMGKCMEAAAENGVEFMVLDRPNPLGGQRVEGPLTQTDCISFVSQYPIPYIYGLTAGELARYLKGEGLINKASDLSLTVVPMQGWRREMTYADTGLPWVLPSPHIPTAETALYYPASGILGELDFISIGVGYTMPFRTFAAPWIDEHALAKNLNDLDLPGILFRPVSYKPYYGKYKGEQVAGVEMYVTDPQQAELTKVQFYVMDVLHRMYPTRVPLASDGKNDSRLRMFDQVTGSRDIRRVFSTDYKASPEFFEKYWDCDREAWLRSSRKYHIYK